MVKKKRRRSRKHGGFEWVADREYTCLMCGQIIKKGRRYWTYVKNPNGSPNHLGCTNVRSVVSGGLPTLGER